MIAHNERLTGSTSSGVLTLTTARLVGGRLMSFTIAPTTATTTYDVEITDTDGDRVFQESGIEGEIVRDVDKPVRRILTVAITGASIDEAFVVKMRILEGNQ